MDGNATWRKLFAWWPWRAPAPPAQQESDALSKRELRQRRLKRLLSRGIPHWTEEPEDCDGCGRELLPGEQALLMRRGDELLLACPLCAERLLGEGCLRIASDAERGAAEEEGLAPAD